MIDTPNTQDQLQSALAYRSWGWSVLPVGPDKKPLGRWRHLRWRLPSDKDIARLITPDSRCCGVGVVLGHASGGLGCRDFDTEAGYHRWATAHPDWADRLPTVRTARGYHVYHRTPFEAFRKYQDGDYRGDSAHFALLPGSVHPSGHVYSWLGKHPGPFDFHLVDPRVAGLLADNPVGACKETPPACGPTLAVDHMQLLSLPLSSLPQGGESIRRELLQGTEFSQPVREAVFRSLPSRTGERNGCLWRLAGELKALDARMTAAEWADVFGLWWKLASPVVATKDRETSWADFVTALRNRTSPAGGLRKALANRCTSAGGDTAARLRTVCTELAARSPGGVFFLSERMAANAIGVTKTPARRQIEKAVAVGWLEVVKPGTPSRTDRKDSTTWYRLANT